jgi:Family of unknown function (DUF6494)
MGDNLGSNGLSIACNASGVTRCADWHMYLKKLEGDGQMSDGFNMSMRKFLKQVGVTSQQAIEEAMRNSPDTGGRNFEVKAVVTIDELGLKHVVTGKIEGQN